MQRLQMYGLLAWLALTTPDVCIAQSMVVQRTPLAGFTHHAAQTVWDQLREGDALQLVLETSNPYDAQAVRVDWHKQTLGYLPRTRNGAIARALDAKQPLSARIGHLRDAPDPRRRVEIEILAPLAASAGKD
ncbi:HIRAN domain-containing protein [Uliginosibacterium gangwonense]|uniref:HIRAN domain-containing protein n=1 Tax=Uliginosibacterium gangwonense TaxID=392736 RepID=UPI000366585E|nr:HIRAN domain-containing protein [Uliginosibacterium gangwonense]